MRGIFELLEEAGDDEGGLLADVDGVVSHAFERPGDEKHRHRPLAAVLLVTDLDREAEAFTVEVVDHVVAAYQIAREVDIACGESRLGLAQQGPDLLAHRDDVTKHPLIERRLVAGQGDQLGDVHALVAHALDRLDQVEQRGDQSQVSRHRGLRREQGQNRLVHFEVAAIDPVVVGNHHLRKLDVAVLDRLDRPTQRLDDEIDPAESTRLELV